MCGLPFCVCLPFHLCAFCHFLCVPMLICVQCVSASVFIHTSVCSLSVCVCLHVHRCIMSQRTFSWASVESTDLCVLALPPCAVCKLSCVYKGVSVQLETMVDESGDGLSAWVRLPDHDFTVCQSIYVYVLLDIYV